MSALVKVRNVGQRPFVDSYENKVYRIEPGSEVILDSDVACLWLGYPGLKDDPLRANFVRRDQFERLQKRYGFYGGIAGQGAEQWDELRPSLEVYTMAPDGDTAERVWMIVDDPTGEKGSSHIVEQPVTGGEATSALQERLEKQERELAALRKLVEARSQAEEEPQEIPQDAPRKVPVGARRGSADR